jgi:ABC-type Zn uptake system ZnuABC Zn-binding protein ZnuA
MRNGSWRALALGAAALAAVGVAGACGSGSGAASSTSGTAASTTAAAAVRNAADFTCPPAATSAGADRSGPRAGRLRVVTTVAPITSIVANVAGDAADVVGVIPEGEDSHTYEPKPSVAELFSTADVVFVNGLSLEDPTRDLAKTNLPKDGQIVELGTLALRPDQYIFDFSFPKDGGRPNPHLWTDPPMARCSATAAASVLAKADPANADVYRRNAAAFEAKVDDLDVRFRTASDTVTARHRELLTYHDAYAYFAAHYGWKVIGAIQVSSFEDPTPKEVASLISQVKREQVPAIFGSEVFPSTVLAEIGRETGVKYVDKLRDDDLPGAPGAPDHSYLGLMKADFVTMIASLGGDPSGLRSFDPSDVTPDRATYPQ